MSSSIKRGLFLFLLVVAISSITIYYTVDKETFVYLESLKGISLVLAFLCLAIGMYFDGLRLQLLLRMAGYSISLVGVLRVIFGNYFLALLTPGATGGALAQVLILRSYKVPPAEGTSIVITRTIFSIFFLCFAMPFIFYWYPMEVPYITKNMLLLISLLLVISFIGGLFFLQSKGPKILLVQLSYLIKRLSLKNNLIRLNQLNHGFEILYKNPVQGMVVFLESGLSLLFLYAIVPALMYAFTDTVAIGPVLGAMILLNIILYFAPTPGGTGVAEGLFIFLMGTYVPNGTVGIIAVAWRVIAEYIPFFIGMYAVFTLYGSHQVSE